MPELLRGVNCTVFAYGATGAGKTHTEGGCRRKQAAGIIPRFRDIFAQVQAGEPRPMRDWRSALQQQRETKPMLPLPQLRQIPLPTSMRGQGRRGVDISYLEVYNEKIYICSCSEREASEPRSNRGRTHPRAWSMSLG